MICFRRPHPTVRPSMPTAGHPEAECEEALNDAMLKVKPTAAALLGVVYDFILLWMIDFFFFNFLT
jgi:hypothetical protein